MGTPRDYGDARAMKGERVAGDRLGAHAHARYRFFRQLIDEKDELLDERVFGELQNVVGLHRELESFERADALLGLTQTGSFVELLHNFNCVLDSAFAFDNVEVPEDLTDWKREFKKERHERVQAYGALCSDLGWLRRDALDSDESRQLQLLTALKAGCFKYSKHADLKDTPLTDSEELLLNRVYNDLAA